LPPEHDDRVVLIAGGSDDAVQGIVSALRSSGATVVATSHRPRSIDGATVEVADLLDHGAIKPLIGRVIERTGRIDALVCFAGGFVGGSFIQSDDRTWSEIVEINVTTVAAVIRATLPTMTERGYGRIVAVGAKPSLDPSPNLNAQAAAKESIVALTRSIGRDLRGTGVTMNCLLPGPLNTATNRELLPRVDRSAWITPEALGGVVAFFCSEAAGAIRGVAIPVTGDG
jgi:NAD(P)-dependent dehydrogenase (short-subunit alcohol dehydrogenase family)